MKRTNPLRKYAPNTRGKPFEPGNAGKPSGARHRATILAETLLDGESEALTRKAVDLALAGDVTALRLCLDRILPPRRDRSISFALPPITTSGDIVQASAAVANAVAEGALTPMEAASLSQLLTGVAKAIEVSEFEIRLAALEAKQGK
jgi:hypothetical protein